MKILIKEEIIELIRTSPGEFNKYRSFLHNNNIYELNLRYADLRGVNLSHANLIGVDLSGANLTGAYLIGASLRGANLIDAKLNGAKLSGANLIGTDLRRANLSGANLIDADFEGYQLNGFKYNLIFWKNQIQIGCEIHLKEEWKNFTDKEIFRMGSKEGLKWWKENKEFVLDLSHKFIEEYGSIG